MTLTAEMKRNGAFSELTKKDFEILLKHEQSPSISIYMPAHPARRETREDAIRLKTLLQKAEAELIARAVSGTPLRTLLEPAQQLVTDESFPCRGKGVVLFMANGFFRAYDLPIETAEQVVVGKRFHLRPLLPLVTGKDRFHVLALSQKHVRLLRGTPYGIEEIQLHNVPANLFAAFEQESFERQKQFHTASRAGARERPIAHGGGLEIKDRLATFFRRVNKGVMDALRGQDAPLILAGVNYLLPIYREVNTYPALLGDVVAGNPDELSPQELHAAGCRIIGRGFECEKSLALAQFRELGNTTQVASNTRAVVAGALEGHVLFLFLSAGAEQWGFCDSGGGTVHLHHEREPGDEDLLNFAAIHTLLHGGEVYSVSPADLPEGARMGAVFRF
jgi:hypothetical protein